MKPLRFFLIAFGVLWLVLGGFQCGASFQLDRDRETINSLKTDLEQLTKELKESTKQLVKSTEALDSCTDGLARDLAIFQRLMPEVARRQQEQESTVVMEVKP